MASYWLMLVNVYGSHVVLTYSRIGLTRVWLHCALTVWGQLAMFLLRKARELLAFLVVAAIWSFQVSFSDM